MKKFLSIEKFQELKVLFILQIIMGLMLTIPISSNEFSWLREIDYWDWRAFTISIGIWILCSILDREKYWNLATFLSTVPLVYFLWFFTFKFLIIN